MSTDYCQYCFIGVAISVKDIEVVDSEAIYELQNRYCTRTGKVVKQEKILVKDKQSHYELDGKSYKYIEDIEGGYPGLNFRHDYQNGCIFIGKSIKGEYYGNVNLIDKPLSLERIQKIANKVQPFFPNVEIQLHLFSSISW